MKKYVIAIASLFMLQLAACAPKATPAPEAQKAEEAAKEAPKAEAPAPEPPKAEAPAPEAPAAVPEAPKAEEPKAEEPPKEEIPEINGTLEPKGLVLEMGVRPDKHVEMHHRSVTLHGPYLIQEMYDGLVAFSTERFKKLDDTPEAREAAVKVWADNPRDIVIEKDDAMSARMQHPVWKITYMTGRNEDSTRHQDYYIQTENFDYRFHTGVGADWYEDNKPTIDKWIENLRLVEK